MPHLWLRFLLITPVLALLAFGPGAVSPASGFCQLPGPPCGDGIGVPCFCGDTVVTDTRLNGSDPVLQAPCLGDGLFVASGVTLKINGAIRSRFKGFNVCSGIVLFPGATNVVVATGRIVGFDFGVEALGVTGSRFSGLQIVDSDRACMFVEGNSNFIEGNVTKGCGFRGGIDVRGNGNLVSLNRTEEGSGDGISVSGGSGNRVLRNLSQRNGFDGVVIGGDNNFVDRNRSKYNDHEGYVITGTHHQVTLNIAEENGTDGFTVEATASTFTRNRSDGNGSFGIDDSGGGNTYTDNNCTNNVGGPSNPPGLC